MTMMNAGIGSVPDVVGGELKRTARATGLLYLGLAITGVLGSILIRAQLFADDDPDGTLSNLMEHGSRVPISSPGC